VPFAPGLIALSVSPTSPPPAPAPSGVAGSPADVRTRPGIYGVFGGYEVSFGCGTAYYENMKPFFSLVFVRGMGSRKLPRFEAGRESETEFWRVANDICLEAGLPVGSAGATMGCTSKDSVITLEMHDWRNVDDAIVGVGRWLASHDSSGEVAIRLEPKHREVLLQSPGSVVSDAGTVP
jgi:hypothetical protein